MRRSAAIAVALAAASTPACRTPEPRLVVVVVDTLRPDRLGVYGHTRPTSPALDAWARTATVFESARSPAPWTLPAGRALLGAGPVESWQPHDTLATRLQAAGWHTGAVVANPHLGPDGIGHAGWDAFTLEAGAPAESQAHRATAMLEAAPGDRPAFLLLHFMDPHLPYEEDSAHRSLWAGPAPSERLAAGTEPVALQQPRPPLDAAELAWLSARYDQNVRAVDDALASVLAALRPTDTLVFTADHGEALGESGGVGHGHGLTEDQVRVPLLIGGPGWPATRRSEDVELADVGATVLAIAGAPAPDGATGRDLRGSTPAHATRLSHTRTGPARVGWVSGSRKWVGTAEGVSHFDLGSDPEERTAGTAPWSVAEAVDWSGTSAPPLMPVWVVGLAPPTEIATQQAQPGVQSVTLTHPGGVAGVDAPPRLPNPSVLTRKAVADGWTVTTAGALPRELWFRPVDPGAEPADATLAIELRGELVDGRRVPGVTLSNGMAPVWPKPPASRSDPQVLEALGYVEPR